MKTHEFYIRRCIELARKGAGAVSPNPMVGSVIVHQGKIIGEGWHQQAGKAHAEVNAINSVLDPSLLKKSTIYVSLEPCAHYGKTPPCADLIVRSGIPKVVIGSQDPFPQVAGKGVKRLQKAGVQVIQGVLQKECDQLNKFFLTATIKKRPYVVLKWAQSEDGYIDANTDLDKKGVKISNAHTARWSHKLRSQVDAILVGRRTVQADNPQLDTRNWAGKNPTPVILDTHNKLTDRYLLKKNGSQTIVLNTEKDDTTGNVNYCKLTNMAVPTILQSLHEQGIQSIMVEGGRQVLLSFINSGVWDEAMVLQSPIWLGKGLAAPSLKRPIAEGFQVADNKISIYKNQDN